jgi:uncharacterized protein YbjT (DUF2867 family)
MRERILLTGGTGTLGSITDQKLKDDGFRVRIMSRQPPKSSERLSGEWAVADLTSGDGVSQAVEGVDWIIHAASSPFPSSMELNAARNLLQAAQQNQIRHLVYISILGVDRIDFSYYQSKSEVEKLIKSSGLDYSIIRSAQFHTFVESILAALTKLPIVPLPKDWRFQSISPKDVADHLVGIIHGGPIHGTRRIAGPEILTLREMLTAWQQVFETHKPVLSVPMPGGLSKGFSRGDNTDPSLAIEGETWRQYLMEKLDLMPNKRAKRGGIHEHSKI